MSAVEFVNVTKRYGAGAAAVNGVSFTIEAGTLVTLLGPSGCGKTTTLRMIAGLEMASSGRIRIGGVDVTQLPATERDVGMVFQSYALFPHMNVLENVSYGLIVSKVARAEASKRALAALETVGLGGLDQRRPSELSGGQQQRVALARALVLEPKVLLFDEPLSNLDARLRRKMRLEIRELQQRLRLTSVYVTHDQVEAMSVSDRIIVMEKGVIAQEGPPRELYERPRSLFVASFMGDANVVDAEAARRDGKLVVKVAGVPLELEDPRPIPDGPVKISIRPEAIEVSSSGPLAARITKAAYLGSHMEYELETPVGPLFAISTDTTRPRVAGDPVQVTLHPTRGVTLIA